MFLTNTAHCAVYPPFPVGKRTIVYLMFLSMRFFTNKILTVNT